MCSVFRGSTHYQRKTFMYSWFYKISLSCKNVCVEIFKHSPYFTVKLPINSLTHSLNYFPLRLPPVPSLLIYIHLFSLTSEFQPFWDNEQNHQPASGYVAENMEKEWIIFHDELIEDCPRRDSRWILGAPKSFRMTLNKNFMSLSLICE